MRAVVVVALCWIAGCSNPAANGDDDVVDDAGSGSDSDASPEELVDPAWPANEPLPPEIDFPPYVNLQDATTVVVSWRTVAVSTGTVSFGTTEALGTDVASSTSGNLHHVTLENLTPGAAYYYQVAITGTQATREGVFVMPGRASWRFMHVGEYHAPSESSNVTDFTEQIRAFRPHVLLESGDMVDDGNSMSQWRNYMRTSAPWISNLIIIPAHSNHVNGSGGNTNLKDIFVVPNNERWFTTRYGQVLMISLDSTYSANDDVEDVEVPWLAETNAAAHDGTDDPAFVITAWHHPACSSQYLSRSGERAWVQTNFIQTLKDSGGVDLVLAAHDKYYERNVITGGIQHVITNIGNVSPEIPGQNHASCTAMKTDRSTQSILLVNVDDRTLSAKAYGQTGVELDAFTITK